jgi:hypothetical protein
MRPDLAEATYDRLLHPAWGIQRRAAIDLDGVRTVLALRSRYGQPQKTLSDPTRYWDSSWYDRAVGA